ncbi:MAG: hypothetical protein FJ288_03020 [Planctomycetes bacterium]|nr:hypothetical protein [Planctomycetota bacterium]
MTRIRAPRHLAGSLPWASAALVPSAIAALMLAALPACADGAAAPPRPDLAAWDAEARKGPMTAGETKDFMKRLARYVFDHHLKKTEGSKQRGMVYEYLDTTRIGHFDQFVQGEALDTMHDGAWLAAALVNAYRATADPFYKDFLVKWQLPFYCLMLNHSDTLFSAGRNDAAPGAHEFGKEHRLIDGEKGFAPYWWDDGASVSLERRLKKQALGAFACVDNLAGKPNPQYLLDGYSLGCSNHMAQDLAVMLQAAWLLLKDSASEDDKRLASEVAEAAKNLYESRLLHHGPIPAVTAAAALPAGDARRLASAAGDAADFPTANHYTAALYDFTPGQKRALPAFADDQQYRYCAAVARFAGRLPPGVAFRTIYDAYTEPMLWRYFCDASEVLPGLNRGEYGHEMAGGTFDYYESDKKGVRFLGSRMGPQNMVTSAIALQLLKAHPGAWAARYERKFPADWRVFIIDPAPGAAAEPPRNEVQTLGPVTLSLTGTRYGLMLCGTATGDQAALRIYSRPDAKGTHATITLKKGGPIAAVNDKGETLLVVGKCEAHAERLPFDVFIPYTVAKGQKPWANGIEHGRCSIQAGDATRNFYLISPPGQVKAWLEREVGQGLRVWDAVFRQYGYVPTHMGRNAFWDGLSDCGGYAHLISAGAEWLLYLEGKEDWEVHRAALSPIE